MDNIRLLEHRVERTIRRLHELTAEREELEREVRSLHKQLEDRDLSDEVDDPTAWRKRRDDAVALIRRTLDELRSD